MMKKHILLLLIIILFSFFLNFQKKNKKRQKIYRVFSHCNMETNLSSKNIMKVILINLLIIKIK